MEERKANLVILSLGSNQGNREAYLRKAVDMLTEFIGKPLNISSIYETPPLGFIAPQTFYNCAALFQTTYSPEELLAIINDIERKNNRQRIVPKETRQNYTSRTLDIDIIYFSNQIVTTNQLIIPHPRRLERKFVLTPIVEICPNWIDPMNKRDVNALLAESTDSSKIKKITNF
jgi:deoxyguanosine kinase